MNTLKITADEKVDAQLELSGNGIEWCGNSSRGEVTRLARVSFLVKGDDGARDWLRFDVTPDFSSPPGNWPTGSTLFFNGLTPINDDNPDRRLLLPQSPPLAEPIKLRIHIASPLTPSGAGLWINLVILPVNGHLNLRLWSEDWFGRKRWDNLIWFWRGTRVRPWINISSPEKLWSNPGSIQPSISMECWLKEWLHGGSLQGVRRSYATGPRTYTQSAEIPPLLTRGCDRAPWLVEIQSPRRAKREFFLGFAHPVDQPGGRTGRRDSVPLTSVTVTPALGDCITANADALATEKNDEKRPGRRWLVSEGIEVVCGRILENINDGSSPRWCLEWVAAPGGTQCDDPNILTLRTLYEELCRHYPLGLAAARSRNRLTLVPTLLKAAQPVTLRFLLTSGDVHLRQIALGKNNKVTLRLGGMVNWDGTVPELEFEVSDGSEIKPLQEVLAKGTMSPLLQIEGRTVGSQLKTAEKWLIQPIVSGVLIRAKSLNCLTLRLSREPGAERYGQAPIGVHIEGQFKESSLTPVSQDPEIGFETQSAWLERERPMVIELADRHEGGFGFTVMETAHATQSRLLRLAFRVSEGSQGRHLDTECIVLDPSPLMVAKVQSEASISSLSEGELVAEYTDDSDQAPEWTLRSDGGGMDLVLPPQVIGEEMIKGRLYRRNNSAVQEVPELPFDFRLSMPAYLRVDRSDVDSARAAAPWAIRRLLSLRLGAQGLKLDQARFELFYGLITELSARGLRIAELDAFVGRIPFSDDLINLLRFSSTQGCRSDSPGVARPERLVSYGRFIQEWIRALLYRPSWWPLFRTWSLRETLTISDRVRFTLRTTRETANPFEPDKWAISPSAEHQRTGHPLCGGVDWPFQSQSVYEELLESEPGVGSVTGVAFGSLGGTGSQTAGFNNGKTLIITDTTQGRVNSVTLIRVGRIGMLLNHARHVLVYERTSRRAPRYKEANKPDDGIDSLEWQSDKFDGFGALRKVREYLEITQPRRRYPDTETDRPVAGPLVQSTFETVVIPVKACWGHDIPGGWVMPLHGPVESHETNAFPVPKVFLELARAAAKGDGTVAHQVLYPAQLQFFTSTSSEDGGDTDRWPAWPDVDFPLIRQPERPSLPLRPSFTGAHKQPDAAPSDFGQGAFTVELVPAMEPVNLMHGRAGAGIEASVLNVTLARGQPDRVEPSRALAYELAPTFADLEAQMRDGMTEAVERITTLARQYPDRTFKEIDTLRTDLQRLLSDLRSTANKAAAAIRNSTNDLANARFSWEHEQTAWSLLATRRLEGVGKSILRQLEDPTSGPPDRVRLRHTLEAVWLQAKDALEGVGFLPVKALNRIRSTKLQLCHGLLRAVRDALDELRGVVGNARRRWSEFDTSEVATLSEALHQALLTQVERILGLEIDAANWIEKGLGPWFGSPPRKTAQVNTSQSESPPFAGLLEAARSWSQAEAAAILELADELPPPDVQAPDFEQLESELLARAEALELSIQHGFRSVDNLIKNLAGSLDRVNWREKLNERSDAFRQLIDAVLQKLPNGDPHQELKNLRTGVIGFAGDVTSAVDDKLNDLFERGWKGVPGEFNRAEDLGNTTGKIVKELWDVVRRNDTLQKLADEFRKEAEEWNECIRAAGLEIEQAVRTEFAKFVGSGLVTQAHEAVLEVTRVLASGPVNDAIACTREALGYYYKSASPLLELTRSSARFNDLGPAALNALSAEIPFDRIRDRLLPQLEGMDLNRLLPDFGGLKLRHLLPDLKIPKDRLAEYDWLSVKHGFDKDRLTAWSDVRIDMPFEHDPVLFRLPPVELRLLRPRFSAFSRMELSETGTKLQRTEATLAAHWQISLGGRPLVTFRDAALRYNSEGGFDFDFDGKKVQLAEQLRFVTQALQRLVPQVRGVTLTPIPPAGIRAELCLPLPDLSAGAFSLTGVRIFSHFDLLIGGGFEVRTGFWLSKPERPFGLSILFLGGGGWFGVEVGYRPPLRFSTRISVGISAGAFLSLNLGVARGSAGLLFTAGLDFYRDDRAPGRGGTAFSLGLLIWGEFSILGIASASLRLGLLITYQDGAMTGHGVIVISIKIFWCFTLRVNRDFTITFKSLANAPGSLQNNSKRIDRAVRLYFDNLDFN